MSQQCDDRSRCSDSTADRSARSVDQAAQIAAAPEWRDACASLAERPHLIRRWRAAEHMIPERRRHAENPIGLAKMMRQMPRPQRRLDADRRFREVYPIVDYFIRRKARDDPAKENHP